MSSRGQILELFMLSRLSQRLSLDTKTGVVYDDIALYYVVASSQSSVWRVLEQQ